MFCVTLYCRHEDEDVLRVLTEGRLDATAIRKAALNRGEGYDEERAPDPLRVEDGRPVYCRRCSGLLRFKLANGSVITAVPGAVEVTE